MFGSCSTFTRRLLRWYRTHRRDLPWRPAVGSPPQVLPDPYRVLVSEAMLQQTQVATVVPYFHRFLQQFPTLAQLAAAPEQEVLRQWQGLGYYSRARNLQRAAQQIVNNCHGCVPQTVEALRALPGVGPYTAGAVASIAFGQRAPILDGNVARVLCRLDGERGDPSTPAVRDRLWRRAEEILPRAHLSEFNSALMELGALLCVPRKPACLLCPVREHCQAFAAGLQEQIPPPRLRKPPPLEQRWTFCLLRDDGRYLLQQRPAKGRWASMWQFITTPAAAERSPQAALATALNGQVKLAGGELHPLGQVRHTLTHRRYEFDIFLATAAEVSFPTAHPMVWANLTECGRYPLPRPHVKVLALLAERI